MAIRFIDMDPFGNYAGCNVAIPGAQIFADQDGTSRNRKKGIPQQSQCSFTVSIKGDVAGSTCGKIILQQLIKILHYSPWSAISLPAFLFTYAIYIHVFVDCFS
jgi:hypothetical protein